jgi:AsmA protein
MRATKFIGLALGAIVILAVLAASVIASRFDPAWARQELARALYERNQRTLTIDGDLALSFYPSLGVRLGKASLSEPRSTQEFASLDSARVSVRLMPLLSRQVVIDHVDMDGVRARIVRGKDGHFNFDDLLSGEQDKTQAPKTPSGKPITFDVAGVQIARCAVVFQDDASGRTYQLDDISARTGRLSQAASGPLELAFHIQSAEPLLKAAITVTGNYRYDLSRKEYALDKVAAKIKGDVLTFKSIDVAVDATHAAWGGAQAGLQVQDLALAAKGKLGDEALDVKFDVPRIASAGERATGGTASGTLRLTGPQKQLDAKLDISGIDGSTATLNMNMNNVAAQWALKQGAMTAQGHAAGSVRADLKGKTLALPKLTGEVLLASPQLPVKQLKMPLDVSGQLDWGQSRAKGNLSTRIEDSAVQGKFQVAKFSPLAASFDLGIDRLDIDRYFPQTAPAKTAQPASSAAPAPAKQEAIDFSFLRGFNLKGAVRVGSLKARNLKFNDVAANVVMNGGRMDLNPLSAKLYGGTLAGTVTAQADGNRVALKQTMDNVNVGQLIRDYAQKDILEGRGHLALDVSTGGSSVAAMRQSLNGTARVSLHDGSVKGIDLAKKLREGKAMLAGGGKESVVAADKTQKTDFSELAASFRITNGVAHNDDLAAKSPFLRVAGTGNVDLVREQIDYVVKATVVASSQGQEGKELAELNGVTVPVRLTGPYDHPSYRLEFGELAASLAKKQVQQRIEQQLGKHLGGDKGGLGDLLKGLTK